MTAGGSPAKATPDQLLIRCARPRVAPGAGPYPPGTGIETMTLTGQQPPCAFPPHPGEQDPDELPEVTVRPRPGLARWVRHAPAERAPAVAIPVVWPAAEIMHAAGLPGLYPGAGTVIAAALAG